MFSARLGLKMSLRVAQTIFITNVTLEGIEKIKTEKMTTKQFEKSREHLQVEWFLFFPQ